MFGRGLALRSLPPRRPLLPNPLSVGLWASPVRLARPLGSCVSPSRAFSRTPPPPKEPQEAAEEELSFEDLANTLSEEEKQQAMNWFTDDGPPPSDIEIPQMTPDAGKRALTLPGRIDEWWFRGWKPGQKPSQRHLDLWFNNTESPSVRLKSTEFYDDFCNALAEKYHRMRGPYYRLEESFEGSWAMIVLLKQISRYFCYNDPDVLVDMNDLACAIASQTVSSGTFELSKMDFIRASFVIMPWVHGENLDQAHVAFNFIRTTEEYEQFKLILEEDAARHLYELDRFGRFPGRNAILGRESTEEELTFLEENGGDEHLIGKK